MKIALVIQKFSPGGGVERACASLARGLLARGHEVHVFAERIAAVPGIREHLLPPEGIFQQQSFAHHARKALETEAFDVVQSFSRTSFQDVLRLGGGIHKEYLDQTDRAYSTLGRWWRRLRAKERWELTLERESLAPSASLRIIANSRRVKDEAVRHYGVPAEKIAVVHNGVDAGEFKPSAEARSLVRNQIGLSDAEYMVLFVGTGFRRKGLDYAVAAVDRVPSAKLVVAGEGRVRSHPRVLHLGRRTDVGHLYAAADALILPTLYDPFPNVALEAMASGIPVIVSRIAGVSELIDADSIVVEEPWNVDELARAVKRLEDPAVRRPMGEAARRKALEHPQERVVDETLKVYEEVLSLKKAQGKTW
jgi:UDP-glucose:(heptosyl)LPS alpha-1,3-glucosyltransferase